MDIISKSKEEYGEKHQDHTIEIYLKYLEMINNVSNRRQSSNNFFLSVNSFIVAIYGYTGFSGKFISLNPMVFWIITAIGALLCLVWFRIIKSYKQLNSGKFEVLHEVEKHLPIKPYDAEWEVLGRGKNRKHYWPFSHLELWVPLIFCLAYISLLILRIII